MTEQLSYISGNPHYAPSSYLRGVLERYFSYHDRTFVNWLSDGVASRIERRLALQVQDLRHRKTHLISRFVKGKIKGLENNIAKGTEAYEYATSDEFRKRLCIWEPWKLDESSVRKGENLYINIAKGYASRHFIDWVRNEAKKYDITENEFLARIIETIRKTEWETIKIMAERGVATTYTLPHLIIGSSPYTDLALFNYVRRELKSKRRRRLKPDYKRSLLFSKEETEKEIGLGRLLLLPYQMQQALAPLIGGVTVRGARSGDAVSIYDSVIKSAFSSRRFSDVLSTVVEEEVHHQGYLEEEMAKRVAMIPSSKNREIRDTSDVNEILLEAERLESDVGIKIFVQEVLQDLPSEQELFEPFMRLVKGPGHQIEK